MKAEKGGSGCGTTVLPDTDERQWQTKAEKGDGGW